MADMLPVNPIAPTPVQQAPNRNARAGFQTAREIEFQARVMENIDSPQTRRAMQRLDKVSRGDTPLRDDVPRGYYLNIEV
jgi:hypothetical protein